ncbi:hypothetical protein J23TS9_44660 [Paenibacillus sp. J23TS9]|uniref:zinc dependent phospholipase C family protein n=1 Tax=Paenibacillus sp. J23TS9 TaxID=2807193 RepID=UPI001B12DA08|nr:zinc dependent phospholipase C family protein [Paenibacillus sp. J23TS9]GIP29336.1 hypothetical protein J23TS9_44660 [Paenibacillus sp. J23TS9]
MPWPMVHFAIAEKVCLSNPSPGFLLGSISPDAIHARDHVTRIEKGATHLMSEGRFPSHETLKTNCAAYVDKNPEAEWKEFVLGYFAHIYADIRWTHTVYADFEKEYSGEQGDIRNTYNLEVSQVEFNLLQSEEWADHVITGLQKAYAYPIAPFVTQQEVSQYRDIKIAWLQDARNGPAIETRYFNEDRVKTFIENTSNELTALFYEWGMDAERRLS